MNNKETTVDTVNGTQITVRASEVSSDRVYLEMDYLGETAVGDTMSPQQAVELGLELIRLGTAHQE